MHEQSRARLLSLKNHVSKKMDHSSKPSSDLNETHESEAWCSVLNTTSPRKWKNVSAPGFTHRNPRGAAEIIQTLSAPQLSHSLQLLGVGVCGLQGSGSLPPTRCWYPLGSYPGLELQRRIPNRASQWPLPGINPV